MLRALFIDEGLIGYGSNSGKPINIIPLPDQGIADYYSGKPDVQRPFTPSEGYAIELRAPVLVAKAAIGESLMSHKDDLKSELAPDVLARVMATILEDHCEPGEGYDNTFHKKHYTRYDPRGRIMACNPKKKTFAEDLIAHADGNPGMYEALRKSMVKASFLQGMLLEEGPFAEAKVYPDVKDPGGRRVEIYFDDETAHLAEKLQQFFIQNRMPTLLAHDKKMLRVTLPAEPLNTEELGSRFKNYVELLGEAVAPPPARSPHVRDVTEVIDPDAKDASRAPRAEDYVKRPPISKHPTDRTEIVEIEPGQKPRRWGRWLGGDKNQ